jgi:hypothetical protein
MDLEDVLIDSALQLSALSRQAAELGHHGLVGRTREEFFRNGWGRHLIPARYGIGNGRVLGVNGMMSSEADVIFYDALDCPKFLPSESTIFPSFGVHGIAEIKSTLDKRELEDAVVKIETFKRLYDDDPQTAPFGSRHVMRALFDPRPFGIVFAFDAATSLTTLMANLLEAEEQMQLAHRCDLIVINNV